MNHKETWHFCHLLLSILTGGLWLVVWLFCTLSNNQHNRKVEMQMMRESLEEMKRSGRK